VCWTRLLQSAGVLPADLTLGTERYIDLDRKDAKAQWEQIKKDNPYGFDIVVEATGVESIVDDSINYVRRGGTLLGAVLFVSIGGSVSRLTDANAQCTASMTMRPRLTGARARSS
jgi:threonine dehydrogenase-like Zn-dependent dehydrogenase